MHTAVSPTAFPFPVPLHPYGRQLSDIPAGIRTWDGWRPIDAVNLDHLPPPGWYSVGHWSALTEPNIFAYFEEPLADVLTELEQVAFDACRKEWVEPIEWPAPPALVAAGIATVFLFPDPILREVSR
ncbi:hypothetical protein [Ancylobacter terrae]|uniref:hypothetical protein n=1 Tax=Ancylobacter sp. sgz301288 TaxID=3342077 RepID=UPI00385AED62